MATHPCDRSRESLDALELNYNSKTELQTLCGYAQASVQLN